MGPHIDKFWPIGPRDSAVEGDFIVSANRLSVILLAVMFLFAAAQCVVRLAGGGAFDLTSDIDRLENSLSAIAYTSPEPTHAPAYDGAIYQVSFRTCPPCVQAHRELLPKLRAAGIETRLVTTAQRSSSTADERAAVVENARRKDWAFTQDWWADNSPRRFYAQTELPLIEGDRLREAELERLQGHVSELAEVLASNGERFGFPAFFWRTSTGAYKAAVGYSPALEGVILADMKQE